MEVEGLGARCALASCSRLDYLPVRCGGCGQMYCGEHQRPESHTCSSIRPKTVPTCPLCQSAVPFSVGMSADHAMSLHVDAGCPKRLRAYALCAHPSCSVRDPAATPCVACHRVFCVAHCVEINHDCTAPKPLANGVFGGGKGVLPSNSRPKSSTEPSKPNAQPARKTKTPKNSPSAVPLIAAGRTDFMNAASNAIGDTKIDTEDRVPVAVYFPAGTNLQARHMYFSTKNSPGKIVDILFKLVPGLPAPSNGQRYSVYAVKPDLSRVNLLPYITPLRELSSVVQPGDLLVLQVGDTGLDPSWFAALQPASPSRLTPFAFSRKVPKAKVRKGAKCLVA